MMKPIYQYTDYKLCLREKLDEEKANGRSLTLKKVSDILSIQYTYLSKAMNDASVHLNEDHVYKFARTLNFMNDEVDYVLLLRSLATATDADRSKYLLNKINQYRQERAVTADHIKANQIQTENEMIYLFNPLCMIVHVSLFIDTYRKDPLKLIPLLGMTEKQLLDVLMTLEKNSFIEMGSEKFKIKQVHQKFPHYGPHHPFMRMHQQNAKSQMVQKLSLSSEDRKDSLFVTFSADLETYELVKQKFRNMLNEVQKAALKNTPKHVYQMSFDFLRLL